MPPDAASDSQEIRAREISGAREQRCAPCQLQLCKGRAEPPHPALKAVAGDATGGREIRYACQTCGITLVRSSDPAKLGWWHHR